MINSDKISLTDIKVRRDNFYLDINNLDIYRGAINFICGHNGSGKTTLIEEITTKRWSDLPRFCVGFSDSFLIKQFTIDQIEEAKKGFHQKWNSDLFDKIIKFTKIDRSKSCRELSSGQTRMLNFALSVAPEEELLILDEPFTGVDYSLRDFGYTILLDYAEDKSVLFSGHEIEEAWRVADIFTIIEDGKIVFYEDKDTIEEEYRIVRSESERDDLKPLFKNRFEGIYNHLITGRDFGEFKGDNLLIPTFGEIFKIVLRGKSC